MFCRREQTADFKSKLIEELEKLPDFKPGIFSKEEDELIRKYYPTKGWSIHKVLGKTKIQINHRAFRLGVKRNKNV